MHYRLHAIYSYHLLQLLVEFAIFLHHNSHFLVFHPEIILPLK